MLSAVCLNLDQSKILSYGNELKAQVGFVYLVPSSCKCLHGSCGQRYNEEHQPIDVDVHGSVSGKHHLATAFFRLYDIICHRNIPIWR